MDDPNIIMEEYIRLEEETDRKRGKVYNWETVMYGKIWYDEDVHNIKSVEAEFPSIVFNDTIIYNDALTSKSDFSTEHVVIPQHIDEFNLKDETSLSECDKEEQNVNTIMSIPFNIADTAYPNPMDTAY
ncbi:hypothetical protein Tco_0341603 [Tanacetum coccineum]